VLVLFVRHGESVPGDDPGFEEDTRPLTEKGMDKFKDAAKGIVRCFPTPDAILTSSKTRAAQTASIAADEWGKDLQPVVCDALTTGDYKGLLDALQGYPPESEIAVFGHEPFISQWMVQMLNAGKGAAGRIRPNKGGAVLIDFPGKLEDGGFLQLFARQGVLRKLGK